MHCIRFECTAAVLNVLHVYHMRCNCIEGNEIILNVLMLLCSNVL